MIRCQQCHYPSRLPLCAVCQAGVPVQRCTAPTLLAKREALYPPAGTRPASRRSTQQSVLRGQAASLAVRQVGRPAVWTPERLEAKFRAWTMEHGYAPVVRDLRDDTSFPDPATIPKITGLSFSAYKATLGLPERPKRLKGAEAIGAGVPA